MKKLDFKKILPHLVAIGIFLIVAIVYCKPALQGKVVSQIDTQGWQGMSHQSVEFHDKYGFYPLWTESMFSGMPAYQIFLDARTHILVGYLGNLITLGLPKPVSFFFLACICFYILSLVAGANPWLGILGGISYAYSTFDPIIISVGHDTQMMSIAYMPAVLAGLLLLLRKQYWLGFTVTALFSALLIGQNHLQMVYYTLIVSLVITITFLIKSYKEKQFASAVRGAALALVAGVLGLACSAVTMMPTYEYAQESMRGGRSELVIPGQSDNKTKGGLDKDYAFRYSLGIPETLTFIVPGLYGGSNGGNEYTTSSKFVDKFSAMGVPEDNAVQYANAYSYWGDQQPTSGPVYLGAIICLLFIFGLLYVKSWHRNWIIAATIIGIVLAWGANFKLVNYFLFDHLPFYNKFRAPSMGLVIPQLCFPLLAVLGLTRLLDGSVTPEETWKKLKQTGIITGVIMVLLLGFYFSASFSGKNDKLLKGNFEQSMLRQVPQGQSPSPQLEQQAQAMSSSLMTALENDRRDLMGGDLLRSFLLIAIAFVIMMLFVKKKVTPLIFIASLTVLSGFDLIGVDTRYLNSNSYVDDSDFESAFTPTEADQQILNDPDHANFRVFNTTVGDPYSDASTSYFFNSVGGYHPAKLGLYNDLITYQLGKGNLKVFDMLNTKYFIVANPQTGKPMAQLNPNAYGNAWLVKGIKYVDNANEEMNALDSTDLRDTAVVEKKYQSLIKEAPVPDSTASISMIKNMDDTINYSFHSKTPQFAVLSEIYYPRGWNAFIDGKKADYVKTNYVLRGMYVPAGEHKIKFIFEPKSYWEGRTITIIANLLVMLSILLAVVFITRQKKPSPAE
jgi:hypothetical protein